MELQEYKCEVLIIGAGPAGLSSAVYCGRANRNTIVLEGKELSSLAKTQEIQNWLGEIDATGLGLLDKFKKHAESYESVKIISGDVIELMLGMGTNVISTRTANITADVVVIATGTGKRKEVIKGEDILLGYGVSYGAIWDGPSYKNKVVYLYGKDEEVMEDALVLKQMGCIVRVITDVGIEELPENVNEVRNTGIEIIEKMEIIEAVPASNGMIQKIICKSTESQSGDIEIIKEFELSCLFIISHISSNSIFKKAGVELDDTRNIKVDSEQKTNIEGIYAAGDCTGGLFQVVFAAAEGARAGINACKYLRQLRKE
ncbi:MAG: FAD-dependent oxidoreductase [Candidatus Lokiarchaeota archaeon]|nr:FAD-dependent oxidoreductase [Candidatus Lokiarchaeota archaeon]